MSLLVVVVGTMSPLKMDACKQAFGERYRVVGTPNCESGVRPQPIGRAETRRGALNRARIARTSVPEAKYAIGIENGMWSIHDDEERDEVKGDNVDVGCIVVLELGKDEEVVFWSDELRIPNEGIEEGPNGEWSVYKDPHTIVTHGKRNRAAFLRDALRTHFVEGLADQ